MSDGDKNPASTPTAVPDVHGDGRWMSLVRCSAEPVGRQGVLCCREGEVVGCQLLSSL